MHYFQFAFQLLTDSWYHSTTAHIKSSNHTLNLHRPTSSTTNSPRLSLTANCLFCHLPFLVMLGILLHSRDTATRHRNNNGFWTGWLDLLTTSFTITINYKNSQSIFSRTLLPWLPRTRPILVLSHSLFLVLILFGSVPLIESWCGSIENTYVAQQWIYANHVENISTSIVIFTAPYIATEVIRLLTVYSLLLECVYRVVV
jgi:hypothetical protein